MHDLCITWSTHFDSFPIWPFQLNFMLTCDPIHSVNPSQVAKSSSLGQMFEARSGSHTSVDPAWWPKTFQIHCQSLLALGCKNPVPSQWSYLWANQIPAHSPVCTRLACSNPIHLWLRSCVKQHMLGLRPNLIITPVCGSSALLTRSWTWFFCHLYSCLCWWAHSWTWFPLTMFLPWLSTFLACSWIQFLCWLHSYLHWTQFLSTTLLHSDHHLPNYQPCQIHLPWPTWWPAIKTPATPLAYIKQILTLNIRDSTLNSFIFHVWFAR